MLIVKEFENPNWLTEKGVSMMVKKIRSKGIPNLDNCRFITLTIDHKQHETPEAAFLVGRKRLERFTEELRKKIGKFGYCWKLEFHQDGWPHWHFILLYKKRLPYKYVDRCWNLGRTNTERIQGANFEYLFKYVTKADSMPSWVLDAKYRIRFWQTSNFYTGEPQDPQQPRGGPPRPQTFYTVREKIDRWSRMAIIENTDQVIKRKKYCIHLLNTTFREMYSYFIKMHKETGFNPFSGWNLKFENPIHIQSWIQNQNQPVIL